LQYQRHLDPDSDDSLARLARRIPAGARILELGPATGYFTRHLREALGCTVDAIELSPEMAHHAQPWCRRIVVGDMERLDLAAALESATYDLILAADVLEHLRDPWSLARRLAGCLAPGGRLLLSVPNVAYLGVLVDLLRGRFRYGNEGLMDRSHLRFFTFDSLRDLLEEAGWHVWDAEAVPLSLTDSEFRVRIEALGPALRDELLARPDALCYQWVVDARREPAPTPFSLPAAPAPQERFQLRVFWRGRGEAFDDARNRLVWGALGGEDQGRTLSFPAGQEALGLRLCDRAGFVRLRKLRLADGAGATLWRWDDGQAPLPVAGGNQVEAADRAGLWYVSGTASRLDLDLPAAVLAKACSLDLRLDAPLSADFLAAEAFWNRPEGLPARLAASEARCRQLEGVRAVLGNDEAAWPRLARVLRLAQRIPGLVAATERLAAWRSASRRRA